MYRKKNRKKFGDLLQPTSLSAYSKEYWLKQKKQDMWMPLPFSLTQRIVLSRENILPAYRKIKNNTGSKTAGTKRG